MLFRKLYLYLLYELIAQYYLADLRRISDLRGIYCFQPVADDYYRRQRQMCIRDRHNNELSSKDKN